MGTLTAINAGCAAAQVRPEPGRCPQESLDAMEKEFQMGEGVLAGYISLVDEPAPEEPRKQEMIAFKEGPITARVIRANDKGDAPGLPKGTLLFGHVWTDPGIKGRIDPDFYKGRTEGEFALVRFTSFKTPKGKTYPACIVAHDDDGMIVKGEGSRPGVAILPRFGNAFVIETWPPPPGPYPSDF